MNIGHTIPSLQRLQRLGKTADFGVQLYVRLKYMKNKKQVGEWIYDEVRQKGPVYIKLGYIFEGRHFRFRDFEWGRKASGQASTVFHG